MFVPLEAVTDPGQVLAAIARAAGAGLAGTGAPLEALAEMFGDGVWLLVLDNLEQVVQAAPDLGELLGRCPGLAMLATSRTVLGLRGEREYPVPPLPLPAEPPGAASVAEVAAWPAVALFVDRARAVRPGFALTEANAAAVAEICRRLEGMPLAIELAAARTRLLDPPALLDRLAASLDALGTGAVDLPERQRTLRATVEWSIGLLTAAERSLLEVAVVFIDGWTVPAAAAVAGLDEDRALELSEALAGHSLVYVDSTRLGPRSRMLETVRAFVAERLAARPDADQVGRRHAAYYRGLAERADRPLRGAGQGEWLERLDAEAGNLAAAVRWYLAHDAGPLPHLFRILWPFWFLRDLMREGRSWVEQLLPAAGALGPQARAELAWAAAVIDVAVGDDAAALADRQRLAPLLAGIQDPFLHAASQLALAWTLPITGDLAGALRQVMVALGELRGQDEPVYTALAAFTAGNLYMALGRYDDALQDMREARDLAEQAGGDWLAAGSRVQLGILAVLRGRPDEARALLEEALDRSLAARSTPFVTLCLAGYAQLAFAEGDPERAARWKAPPRAAAGGPAWVPGRTLRQVRGRPGGPGPPDGWARSGSIRRSPPAPGSPSSRRSPSSGTSAAPRPRRPEPPRATARKLPLGARCGAATATPRRRPQPDHPHHPHLQRRQMARARHRESARGPRRLQAIAATAVGCELTAEFGVAWMPRATGAVTRSRGSRSARTRTPPAPFKCTRRNANSRGRGSDGTAVRRPHANCCTSPTTPHCNRANPSDLVLPVGLLPGLW